MPVKLRDLAREVGVHPSTVSRVLSGDPSARLSEATRDRILRLADETGYRPNRLARSLKIQRTRILGMLIPDVANPFFGMLFRAVEDTALAAGYSVILCNTDDSPERFGHHLDVLGEGHVDGLLIATARLEDAAIERLRAYRSLRYVLVNRRRDEPGDDWVVPDDAAGAHLAVEHLVGLGHATVRIAHVAGDPSISTTRQRALGFREAMARHGVSDPTVVEGGLTEATGERGMRQLLKLTPSRRPTAVFVANDLAAMGAIAAARSVGLRVPEDLSVIGFNDISLTARTDPSLTTLRVPLKELGGLATNLLIRRLGATADPAPPTHLTVPVELVIRGSTAAPQEVLSAAC